MEDMSRSNGYSTYRSNNRRDDMPERPPSDALVDLHVYLVPHNLWRERYNNFLNANVTETVSAGIIRVHPEQKVIVLRDEIDTQIGAELVPREYVFLKSVGRSITKLNAKQEYQLKVKNFIPPQSYAPELFLLEAQDVDSSRSSVRPESPEYTTGRKSDRTPYTSHNTNPTSPEYNMSSAEKSSSRPVAAGNKYDPRLETYTNHTNEDSGIAGLTPEDHYRENQDDVLDRRKRENEEKRRREAELQDRLKADREEREQKEKSQRDKEWERHEQLEEERRRKDEEEKRRREEEKRRQEEEDKRRENEEEARREQDRNLDRLSASDESTRDKVMSGRLSRGQVTGQPDRTSTPNSVKVTVQLNGSRVTDVNVSMGSADGRHSVASNRNISTDLVQRSSSQTTGYLTDKEDSGVNTGYHSDENSQLSGQGHRSNTSKYESNTSQGRAEKEDSNLDYRSNNNGTGTGQGQGQGNIEKDDSRVSKGDGDNVSEGHQNLSRGHSGNGEVQSEQPIQGSSDKQNGNVKETSSTDKSKTESQSEYKDDTKTESQSEYKDDSVRSGTQVFGESSADQYNNPSPSQTRGQGQQRGDSGKETPLHTGPVILTLEGTATEPSKAVSGSRYVGQQQGDATVTQPVIQPGGLQVHSGNSGSGNRKTPSRGKPKEVSWSDDVIDNESQTSSRESNRPYLLQGTIREDSQPGERADEVSDTLAPKMVDHIRPGTYTRPQSSFQGPRRVPRVPSVQSLANSQVSNESPRHSSRGQVVPRPVVPRIQLGSGSSVDSQEGKHGTFSVVHTPSGWHTHRGPKPNSDTPHQDGYQTDVSNQDSTESQPRDSVIQHECQCVSCHV